MSLRSLPAVRGRFPWPLKAVGLFTLATGSVEAHPGREEAGAPLAEEKATFVGAQSCVACHAQTHETWDHATRAATSPDHAPTQLQIGRLHILNRDTEGAARAFGHSYHLDPDVEGIQYFLALARIAQERRKEARQLLEEVTREDPYFKHAQALLEKLGARH